MAHGDDPPVPSGLQRLGWREWLALPDLGIVAVRAKVDTGARSSSLHVESQETFQRDGVEWVRFGLDTGRYHSPLASGEAPVLERRKVTDSGGHRHLHPHPAAPGRPGMDGRNESDAAPQHAFPYAARPHGAGRAVHR